MARKLTGAPMLAAALVLLALSLPAAAGAAVSSLQVSAGGSHTCILRTDQTLACWGSNTFGQATPPAGTYSALSSGGDYTCAIRTNQTLACWGDDTYGQLTAPAGTYGAVSAGS